MEVALEAVRARDRWCSPDGRISKYIKREVTKHDLTYRRYQALWKVTAGGNPWICRAVFYLYLVWQMIEKNVSSGRSYLSI